MSMIQVKNLSFTYEDSFDPVFENVSFQIDTDWKLGFIGRNGKGKTTFLKLLAGEYEYSGSILSSVEFEYFPYPIENKELLTYEIAESITPAMEQWELLRELNLLDADAEILYRPFRTLSFGETIWMQAHATRSRHTSHTRKASSLSPMTGTSSISARITFSFSTADPSKCKRAAFHRGMKINFHGINPRSSRMPG